MIIKLMGHDPAFRNWGMALALYDTQLKQLTLTGLDIAQSKIDKSVSTRKNSKDVEVADFTVRRIMPHIKDTQISFIEMPVGSKYPNYMLSYGYCCGIAGTLRAQGNSIIEVHSQDIKEILTGSRTASKDEVIIACMKAYPHLDWPMQTKKGVTTYIKGKAEHMADAVGAIRAGLETKEFNDLLSIIG
jgi:hypothetical protein